MRNVSAHVSECDSTNVYVCKYSSSLRGSLWKDEYVCQECSEQEQQQIPHGHCNARYFQLAVQNVMFCVVIFVTVENQRHTECVIVILDNIYIGLIERPSTFTNSARILHVFPPKNKLIRVFPSIQILTRSNAHRIMNTRNSIRLLIKYCAVTW